MGLQDFEGLLVRTRARGVAGLVDLPLLALPEVSWQQVREPRVAGQFPGVTGRNEKLIRTMASGTGSKHVPRLMMMIMCKC